MQSQHSAITAQRNHPPPVPSSSNRGTAPPPSAAKTSQPHSFLLPGGKPKTRCPPAHLCYPRNPHPPYRSSSSHPPALAALPPGRPPPSSGERSPVNLTRLNPPPRRSLTYTLQRPSSALRSPPYPGVNQKLTHPRNPRRLHPLHLRALTFTLHHTPQHQGRAPECNVVSSSHPLQIPRHPRNPPHPPAPAATKSSSALCNHPTTPLHPYPFSSLTPR